MTTSTGLAAAAASTAFDWPSRKSSAIAVVADANANIAAHTERLKRVMSVCPVSAPAEPQANLRASTSFTVGYGDRQQTNKASGPSVERRAAVGLIEALHLAPSVHFAADAHGEHRGRTGSTEVGGQHLKRAGARVKV